MQIVLLLRRPTLKTRLIPSDRRKPTVMQPVNHRFFLLHTGPGLRVCGIVHGTHGYFGPFFGSGFVVGVYEAGADEENIADLDVATLRLGADIDALGFSTFGEFVVGDAVGFEVRVGDAIGLGVGVVV